MKNKLKTAMKDAMKAKDKPRLQTIRSLLSAIQYVEMEKNDENLNEGQITSILTSELKKRKESLEFEEKAGRETEALELKGEIAVIEEFLPKQLSEEELKSELENFKASNDGANMGLAMKHLKEKFPNQYDGKLASSLAKEMF